MEPKKRWDICFQTLSLCIATPCREEACAVSDDRETKASALLHKGWDDKWNSLRHAEPPAREYNQVVIIFKDRKPVWNFGIIICAWL